MKSLKHTVFSLFALVATSAFAAEVSIPASRSQLFDFNVDMGEVIVADPEIADVYAHGVRQLSIIGKSIGKTTVRVISKEGKVIQTYTVDVVYDLPALRKALKQFIPTENIAVEVINNRVALTGKVSSAAVADRAVQIAETFLLPSSSGGPRGEDQTNMAFGKGSSEGGERKSPILNFMQVTSSQQVMLSVRVGEMQRSAIKRLGIDWSIFGSGGNFFTQFAVGTGTEQFAFESEGDFIYDTTSHAQPTFGWQNGRNSVAGLIKTLERDGLFKLLAEPNLTAISGEEAEFLAGGEIPIPVPDDTRVTIQYKPYGVGVKFRPFVLTQNRLRIEVQPEVSELDPANALIFSGFKVPALTTRRAKTTVELAPGESFMIGGLIRDDVRVQADQIPGLKELPVLGALFRSTDFQRNESELVIVVTPYLVDPIKSSDIKLPTDGYAAPTQKDLIFYGNISGNKPLTQTPALEGPSGFMTE